MPSLSRHASLQVLVRIQHHPSRAHLIPPLVFSLAPLPVEVIEHASEPPNPWHGYQLCLSNLPKEGHVCVLQDDVLVAANFAPALKQIAAANPDTPVVLFLSRLPRRISTLALRASKKGERYVETQLRVNEFMPVVAILWPVEAATDFMLWAQHERWPLRHPQRSDDAMAGKWSFSRKRLIRFSVPSIVQHPDEVPSLIGRRPSWGKDAGRVACLMAEDAASYDWTLPPS